MTIPLESNQRGDRVVKRVRKEAPGWMIGFPPGWVELVLMVDGEIIFASLSITVGLCCMNEKRPHLDLMEW